MNEIIYLLEKGNACQDNYFYGVVEVLNKFISGYSIIMTTDYKLLPTTQYKKIVILVAEDGDRTKAMPYLDYTDVLAVFRFYSTEWGYDNKYVFPIHCGYNCRTDGYIMRVMYPEKKTSEREYDIFYSGQRLEHRKELVRRLDELRGYFNVFSQVNPMLRLGLTIDEYYRFLGDSKICVVPDGVSIDTFRYAEACGSGCIVITTHKPDLWYYRHAPVYYVNDWGELTKQYIENILHDDLNGMQDIVKKYYSETLSEEAVANYIIENVKWLEL